MTVYDVFNGDADGICALVQLRQAEPLQSELITGVKRDIKLLKNVEAVEGDRLIALDISMDKNKDALIHLLNNGVDVFYCDHHVAGDIPEHDNLTALINTAPDICTSLLVNSHLNGAFAKWAIVGAFGDNLDKGAQSLARSLSLSEVEVLKLKDLGIYINYNGYGASLDDLHFEPVTLFQSVNRFSDPLDFVSEDADVFAKLENGYHADMTNAEKASVLRKSRVSAAFSLPNEKWARRVSGVYGNALANASPDRAHAVLTEQADNSYLVSVRAPLNNKILADTLCMEFPTGGGRKAAAGINALPADMVDAFLDRLDEIYR